MLPNGMDIAVLVIVGIFVFLGWKKGLLKMGIQLLSSVLALVLAIVLHPFLSSALQETPLYERLIVSVSARAEHSMAIPEILQDTGILTSDGVAEYLVRLLMNGLSFFLILILARVGLFFLGKLIKFVTSLPILGFVNRLTGMAIGVLEGMLVVWVLLAMLVVVPSLRENKPLSYAVEQSVVARSLYYQNPVLNFLMPEALSSDGK